MRQRKIKEVDKKINSFGEYLIREPEKNRGKWLKAFERNTDSGFDLEKDSSNKKELYAEIGCGKGQFITGHANLNPGKYYIGFEGNETVIYRALQKVKSLENENSSFVSNVRFCPTYIYDIKEVFAEGELNGIFLNFSDPWPKVKHEKRRLTQPYYVEGYYHSLACGGMLELKTDNEKFFNYSIQSFKKETGFELETIIYDIQKSEQIKRNIETEYEHKFNNMKRKIMFLRAVKRC